MTDTLSRVASVLRQEYDLDREGDYSICIPDLVKKLADVLDLSDSGRVDWCLACGVESTEEFYDD